MAKVSAPLDTPGIWKELGEERRKKAAQAFYDDTNLKEFHRAAELFIARSKNFRPAFVKRLPQEKRVQYLATLTIPPDLIGQLIVTYHFAYKKPLMTALLNALGIANEDGVISDSVEVKSPEKQALTTAVEKVRAEFPADDVRIYFATLQAQNPETWGVLGDI
jgi:hypothetical protein